MNPKTDRREPLGGLGNEPESIKIKWDKIGGKRKISSIFEAGKR
jgi:hypothetical protein